MKTDSPALTDRLTGALALAQAIHGRQRRPGTQIPYVAHLLVVTGLVLEDGGDEDQAIAAMLHDSVEDGGGRPMLDRIALTFGRRVAEIVEGCSDTVEGHPIEPWIERKRCYLAHLQTVDDDAVLRVALADKVHNARSIVRHCRQNAHGLWERFGDRSDAEELWYYVGLLELFEHRRPGPLTEDLRRAVAEIARLVARDRVADVSDSFDAMLRRPLAPVTQRPHSGSLQRVRHDRAPSGSPRSGSSEKLRCSTTS